MGTDIVAGIIVLTLVFILVAFMIFKMGKDD